MPTPQPPRQPGLDTLRALAITLVLIFHLQSYLPTAFAPIDGIGWMGVDLFFVLSGYLIGRQLLRPYRTGQSPNLARFYARRACRILPAYLFVLLLYLAWPAWREWPGLAPAWKFLTFTENLILNYPSDIAFSHAWSLCVEEHFYLLLALMRKPCTPKTIATIAAVVLLGIALRAWELFHVLRAPGLTPDQTQILFMKRIYYPTLTRLDGLLDGVTLAALQLFRPHWWAPLSRRPNLLLTAGLSITAAAIWLFRAAYPDPSNTAAVLFGFPILSLGLAALTAAATCDKGLLRLPIPGAQTLATLSFSLYLSHKAVAHLDRLAFPSLEQQQTWPAAALYALTCLTAAAILYACIERPFLYLRDLRDPPPQPNPPTQL